MSLNNTTCGFPHVANHVKYYSYRQIHFIRVVSLWYQRSNITIVIIPGKYLINMLVMIETIYAITMYNDYLERGIYSLYTHVNT